MKEMWRSDSCYSSYGVDGSTCSFFIYLSEVSTLSIFNAVPIHSLNTTLIGRVAFNISVIYPLDVTDAAPGLSTLGWLH